MFANKPSFLLNQSKLLMLKHLKLFYLLPISFLFVQFCTATTDWKTSFDSLKKEWVPDTRVAIFEYVENPENESILFKTSKSEAVPAIQAFIKSNQLNAKVSLLPISDLAKTRFGIVILSVANMRKTPSESAELTTQSIMGSVVNVFERKGGWARVQTPDSYIGWMDTASLLFVDESGIKDWINSEKVVYTDNYGLLSESKKNDSFPVSDLTAGNLLKLISTDKKWLQVATPDGRQGFVLAKSTESLTDWKNEPVPSAAQLLNTAKRFSGVPYLWGGTSFKGVDCSGFTKMTFFMHGIQLPRDASQQVHVGEAVETDTTFKNVKPGDLLFFGNKATETKPERVVHVGIYMGDGKMIHSSGRVHIESLRRGEPDFNEYRLKSFLRAKRVLTKVDSDGISSVKKLAVY